ncbi:hypothetical protein QA802_05345 [Streptomyces sp. B21-105]|uniref:hypothetical protein n=1 Tax=Streptomyces sp. B21-105 TaxID=3039417 RepID=UPI002FF21D9A
MPTVGPGDGAVPADLRAAQERRRLLEAELPRLREAATAWRNALGALLAGLIGFSLVRGRSDVGQLARFWAVTVGVLLLLALLAGLAGALLLVRAAHGRPTVVPVSQVENRAVADHLEARSATAALRRGIALTLLCVGLLVTAVATTWYGPPRKGPAIRVDSPSASVCGSVVRLDAGTVVLDTTMGEVKVVLDDATALSPVDACPP